MPQLLDRQYRVVAIDGSDFNQPFNPQSENVMQGKYGQIHVNTLYDVLNKLYLDMVFQSRPQMNEREAASTLLQL